MPDLDRFERSFGKGWLRVYKWSVGKVATNEDIARAIVKALADTVRTSVGFPGFADISRAVATFYNDVFNHPLLALDGSPLSQALKALDRISTDNSGQITVEVSIRAAKSMLAEIDSGGSDGLENVNMPQELACRTFVELTERQFFGKARSKLIDERFGDLEQFSVWKHAVFELISPKLQGLAKQLVANPESDKFRAPPFPGYKKPTKQLLFLPLSEAANV